MNQKKYQIIYADPPWSFSRGAKGGSRLHPTHYKRMTLKEICALKVKDITNINSVLFLWFPSAFAKDAIDVAENWGFKFVSIVFVWVKTIKKNRCSNLERSVHLWMGLGGATRNSSEFCLLAKKGKGLRRISHSVMQTKISSRLKHSEKPKGFRYDIIQLYGNLPRIELFARERVGGWDAWGNEIENDIEL